MSTALVAVLIPIDLGPAWYPIALAILSVPCAWIGWILAERKMTELS
ncbi:MAG: hypothetical protein ABI481_06360 [Pyrinomonadaceae bacterium]